MRLTPDDYGTEDPACDLWKAHGKP
jgi:hypothetical protein